MSNEKIKVFIDSSILVEFKKQSKTDLLLQLLAESRFQLFINSIVLSEYTFYLLAIEGNKSPRSVKEATEIENILTKDKPGSFLSIFEILPGDRDIVPVYLRMMGRYNLLPNDAIILACCKLNNINVLASHDAKDFATACSAESIILLRNIEDLSLIE